MTEFERLQIEHERLGRTAVKINETLAWEAGRREAAQAEVERLKDLVGRYAKHLAFHAQPQYDEPHHRAQAKAMGLDKFSPWLTHKELMEIKRYADS